MEAVLTTRNMQIIPKGHTNKYKCARAECCITKVSGGLLCDRTDHRTSSQSLSRTTGMTESGN